MKNANENYEVTVTSQLSCIRSNAEALAVNGFSQFKFEGGLILDEVALQLANDHFDIERYHYDDPRQNFSMVYWHTKKDDEGTITDIYESRVLYCCDCCDDCSCCEDCDDCDCCEDCDDCDDCDCCEDCDGCDGCEGCEGYDSNSQTCDANPGSNSCLNCTNCELNCSGALLDFVEEEIEAEEKPKSE